MRYVYYRRLATALLELLAHVRPRKRRGLFPATVVYVASRRRTRSNHMQYILCHLILLKEEDGEWAGVIYVDLLSECV